MSSPFASFGGGRVAPGRPSPGAQARPITPQESINASMPQLRSMYQSIFGSGNPMQAMQSIMGSNPKLAQINNMLRMGRNPESLFREMAAQRGIDPDDFIRQLKGNNGQ